VVAGVVSLFLPAVARLEAVMKERQRIIQDPMQLQIPVPGVVAGVVEILDLMAATVAQALLSSDTEFKELPA